MLATPRYSALEHGPQTWKWIDASLAANSWAHQVQGCHSHLQSSPQLCTIISWIIYHSGWPTRSSRSPIFWHWPPHSTTGKSSCCQRPSISGCWPSALEQLTIRGNPGVVTADLLQATEDLLIHSVIPTIYLQSCTEWVLLFYSLYVSGHCSIFI